MQLFEKIIYSSDLTDTKLLNALEVHLAAANAKIPVEDVRVGLIGLAEHHDGPDAPVKVVKDHALLSVKHSILTFWSLNRPNIVADSVVLSLHLQAHILPSH